MEHQGAAHATSRPFITLTGATLVALGLVVLVFGWWLGIDGLTRLHPALESMKANAAVGIALLGGALLAAARDRDRLAAGLAGAAVVLGLVTVVEYALGLDLGIDELLVADPLADGAPGRMGLNSALCLVGLGVGVSLARRPPGLGRAETVVAMAAVTASGALAALALFGYVFGASSAVGLGSATEMALHTSLGMLVAFAGVARLLVVRDHLPFLRRDTAGGDVASRMAPLVVLAIVASGLLAQAGRALGIVADAELELAVHTTLSLVIVAVLLVWGAWRLQVSDDEARVATEAAASTERELHALLAAVDDTHLRVTVDGRVLSAHVGGRSDDPDGIVGQPVADVLPASVAPRIMSLLGHVARAGVTTSLTYRRADGGVTEARLTPLDDGVAVVLRDVSELARAREDLEDLNRDLEDRIDQRTADLRAAHAEASAFAHTAAHDLKNPLSIVIGMLDLLRVSGDELTPERRDDILARAIRAGDRMRDMVDGLLAYAESTSTEEVRDVDLTEVVRWVQAVVLDQSTAAGAAIEVGRLPVVRGHVAALRHVVLNLVTNALKYRDPERPLVVRIEGRPAADGTCEVVVADNGRGIPVDRRDEVFGLGTRLGTGHGVTGAGLGLAAVRRAVEAHGGRIWVADGLDGVGVAFHFTLPVSVAAGAEGPATT